MKIKNEILSLAFICLLSVYLPALLYDYKNYSLLPYSYSVEHVIIKLSVWFLLPFLILLLFRKPLKRYKALRFFIVSYLLFSAFAYASPWQSSIFTALLISFFWISIESTLIDLWKPVLAACLLVTFYCSFYSIDMQRNRSAVVDNEVRYEKKKLTSSVYVILYDELSLEAAGFYTEPKEEFPNFNFFYENALKLQYANTNYDMTSLSVPSMLSGLRPEQYETDRTIGYYKKFNIFDLIDPKSLHIWGAYSQPYCFSLRYKGYSSYCLDEMKQYEDMGITKKILFDLRRFLDIYVISYPAFAIRQIAINDKVIEKIDNFRYLASYPQWRYHFPLEMKRLSDFLQKVGSDKEGFYYYHAFLPHDPYIANRDLVTHGDIKSMSYKFPRNSDDIKKVSKKYTEYVKAADTILGKIYSKIQREDPNAIVIVTTDHGIGDQVEYEFGRGNGNFIEHVVHIPFFMLLPENGKIKSRGDDITVSGYQHIDFLPTLCDLLALDCPDNLLGRSIFDKEQSQRFFISGNKEFTF